MPRLLLRQHRVAGAEVNLRERRDGLAGVGVATRLERDGERLLEKLDRLVRAAVGRLTKLLAHLDPSPETIDWMTHIAGLRSGIHSWVLSELPHVVRTMVAHARPIDDKSLQFIYRAAAGLREDSGRLRDKMSYTHSASSNYDRIEVSLIGRAGTQGLIETRPSAFAPIAVALIAGHEADRAQEREDRLDEIKALATSDFDWFPDVPPTVRELEKQATTTACFSCTTTSDCSLIVNTSIDPYWALDSEYSGLILHMRSLAEKSLNDDGSFFDAHFWPSIEQSCSALMRTCALDILTRTAVCPKPIVLDELLRDVHLYLLSCSRAYIQRGSEIDGRRFRPRIDAPCSRTSEPAHALRVTASTTLVRFWP